MSFKRSNDWTMEELEALPRTRGKASHLGQRYYFSGRLCKHKHISARTLDGKCMRCKHLRNKQYKKDNPEKYNAQPKTKRTGDSYQNTLEHFLFISAKSRAKRRNIEFSLTIADVIIPDICPILGTPIRKEWGGINQTNLERSNQPSLDRIDSKKGYIPENVTVISYRANVLKGTIPQKNIALLLNFGPIFKGHLCNSPSISIAPRGHGHATPPLSVDRVNVSASEEFHILRVHVGLNVCSSLN